MINKIKELRAIIPIPMSDALSLLKENGNDIETCVYLYKAQSIKEICKQTGCDENMATEYYEKEKLDLNKAISSIKNDLYDLNYIPIKNLTPENIRITYQWLNLIDEYDLTLALDSPQLNIVIETLNLIPELANVGDSIAKAKTEKDIIFEGYTENNPLEDFVRRSKQLDDNIEFKEAYMHINLRKTIIVEHLTKHLRNLIKEIQ